MKRSPLPLHSEVARMSWKKMLPAAVVLMLLLPAVLVLSPATAQSPDEQPATVPIAPTVPWVPQVNFEQKLYLDFGNNDVGQPACPPTSQGPYSLSLTPRSDTFGTRPQCTFGGGTILRPASATFQTPVLLRDFNVTTNSSLNFHFRGSVPEGATLTVAVKNSGAEGNTASLYIDPAWDGNSADETSFNFTIPLGETSRYRFMKDQRLEVTITAQDIDTGGSWDLSDVGSYLSIRANDAVRAATWTEDKDGNVVNVYRPLAADAPVPSTGLPLIRGFFAVDSAFGYADAAETDVSMTIIRGNAPVPVGPSGDGIVPSTIDVSRSQQPVGRAVWAFNSGYLDYRGLQTGDYKLSVDARYRQGPSLLLGVQEDFVISAQSARLAAYGNETLSHEVVSGGSTTYVFTINNTGTANDTFRLSGSFVPSPPSGWGVTLGGPHVLDGLVTLAPAEEKFVTLTVRAPQGQVGDSSIVLLRAESTRDPTSEAAQTTVSTRIGTPTARAVDVILSKSTVAVEPGLVTSYPVYVWNRGARDANITLTIVEGSAENWIVDLQQGSSLTDRMVISNVGPGDIRAATMRVIAPVNNPASQTVSFNATLDGSGVSLIRSVTFTVRSAPAVRLDVLDTIGGVAHVAELSACSSQTSASNPACAFEDTYDNGLHGVWYRLWITNSGSVQDTFGINVDNVGGCTIPFPTGEFGSNEFRVYARDANGGRIDRTTVQLNPGETGELYIWRSVDRTMDPSVINGYCGNGGPVYAFVIHVEGENTGAIARKQVSVRPVNDGGGTKIVQIEKVDRHPDYPNTPLVDISNAKLQSVRVPVKVDEETHTYARVTNGASFINYEDDNSIDHVTDVKVAVVFDNTRGWNISIRPRNGEADLQINPYTYTQWFHNVRENVAEGWIDREFDIRIQPPQNTTLIAGTSFPFFIQASINGSDSRTLTFEAIVTESAKIDVVPDTSRIFAHPSEPGAFLLTVFNNGSSKAEVDLSARMAAGTPGADQGWSVVLGQNEFDLPANTNRTLALLVTPPPGAVQGTVGEINVTASYRNADNLSQAENKTYRLFTEVFPADSLSLTSNVPTVTAPPGGFANFTFTLTSSRDVTYVANATPVPNWTHILDGFNVAREQVRGTLAPGDTKTVTLVMAVPGDVKDGSSYSTVVRVAEVGNDKNFDSIPVTVNIQGGKPIASLSLAGLSQTVDRGASRDFELNVANIGNAAGNIRLEVRTADPQWSARFTGTNINDTSNPFVFLGPNEAKRVNVTVIAPLQVPENTVIPIDVTAYSPDLTQSARATLQARIHDYGLSITLSPATVDLIAGTAAEIVVKIRNRGNDNDSLNLSFIPDDELPNWVVEVPSTPVSLEAGAEREIRARIQSPTVELPTPRAYTFKFYAGSIGGSDVNVSKNDTATATVEVLRYRALDVDGDDFAELAVDLDKRNGNGYEEFREISGEGLQTQVVETTLLDGRTRFLLDVPVDRHDGVADVWFDPEAVFAYAIPAAQAFDVTGDASPDYLLDTDRDGKVDRAYDTDSDRYMTATEINAYGDESVQYLIDTQGDARFDVFYDPVAERTTKTQRVANQPSHIVGIDTDDDGKVDKYYNPQSGTIEGAAVANFGDFFVKFWYFFVVFAVLVLVSIVVLVRRRRSA